MHGVHICNAWMKCSTLEVQYNPRATILQCAYIIHHGVDISQKGLVRHLNLIFRSYLATSLNIKEVKSVRAGGSKGLEDFLGAIVPGKGPTSYYT